jgi:hypothetical protein
MLKKKKMHGGTKLVALIAVVAALASAPAASAGGFHHGLGFQSGHGYGFQTDASWAEGV